MRVRYARRLLTDNFDVVVFEDAAILYDYRSQEVLLKVRCENIKESMDHCPNRFYHGVLADHGFELLTHEERAQAPMVLGVGNRNDARWLVDKSVLYVVPGDFNIKWTWSSGEFDWIWSNMDDKVVLYRIAAGARLVYTLYEDLIVVAVDKDGVVEETAYPIAVGEELMQLWKGRTDKKYNAESLWAPWEGGAE
jgi:hypothetical protein